MNEQIRKGDLIKFADICCITRQTAKELSKVLSSLHQNNFQCVKSLPSNESKEMF